jgi:hypothetical protein
VLKIVVAKAWEEVGEATEWRHCQQQGRCDHVRTVIVLQMKNVLKPKRKQERV